MTPMMDDGWVLIINTSTFLTGILLGILLGVLGTISAERLLKKAEEPTTPEPEIIEKIVEVIVEKPAEIEGSLKGSLRYLFNAQSRL